MTSDLWAKIGWTVAVVVLLVLFLYAWLNNNTSDMIASGILAVLIQRKASQIKEDDDDE